MNTKTIEILENYNNAPLALKPTLFELAELPEITITKGKMYDKWVPTKFPVKNPKYKRIIGEFIYPNDYCRYCIAITNNFFEPVKELKLKLMPYEIALKLHTRELAVRNSYEIYVDEYDGEDGEFKTYEEFWAVYKDDIIDITTDQLKETKEFKQGYEKYQKLFKNTIIN